MENMSPEKFKEEVTKNEGNEVREFTVNEMTSKEFYLDKNARFHLHETAIRDFIRTDTFQLGIETNRHLIRGKHVMEVNSGAGIISLFACKAGAKKVISVEHSKINQIADEIIKLNNFQNVIHILDQRVEDIISLPFDFQKVDVIICDWIGYCLLHDSPLSSLLTARDKFLKEGGHILPDLACMYVCAVEDYQHVIHSEHWWGDVYGFDMSCMMDASLTEPRIDFVDPQSIVTESYLLLEVDANVATMQQVYTSCPFHFTTTRPATIHALVLYFDVSFSKCHTYVGFSTSPGSPYTHYQQTALYLRKAITALEGEKIHGVVTFRENLKKPKGLLIDLDVEFEGVEGSVNDTTNYCITF